MSFQNKNKIWINNSLKTGNETIKLLEMLKELGVFKKKAKKRKQRAKPEEQIMEEAEEEFLNPPNGGGGGGAISVDGINPSSKVTDALQVLKSGASASATQQYLLEKAKEEAQVALGKVKDVAQRQGIDFSAYRPSAPKIQFDDEFEDDYLRDNENFFPEKEVVVPEPNYEMQEERGGTDIPQDVMDIDVSKKVSPDEGVFEDTEQEAFQAEPLTEAIKAERLSPFTASASSETEREPTLSEKASYLQQLYSLKGINLKQENFKKIPRDEVLSYIINLYVKFGLGKVKTPIMRGNKEVLRQHIIDLIEKQYDKV